MCDIIFAGYLALRRRSLGGSEQLSRSVALTTAFVFDAPDHLLVAAWYSYEREKGQREIPWAVDKQIGASFSYSTLLYSNRQLL